MKSRVVLPSLVLSAILFLVAACGGGKPSSGEGTLDSSTASTIGKSYGEQIAGSASPNATDQYSTFSGNPVSATRRMVAKQLAEKHPEFRALAGQVGQMDREDCEPKFSSTTDADGDGVYANSVATFSCDLTDAGTGLKITASGTITIIDGDDSKKNSGATIKLEAVKFTLSGTYGGSSFDVSAEINGDASLTVNGKVITAAGNLKFDISGSSGGKSASASVEYWMEFTATGESEENPYTKGTITLNNGFKVSAEGLEFAFLITSKDLTYDTPSGKTTSCLNGGEILAAAASGKIVVVFSANCSEKYYFEDANGTRTELSVSR